MTGLKDMTLRCPLFRDLSLSQYHDVADESMQRLLESLEEITESATGTEEWDVDYSVSLLLTLH